MRYFCSHEASGLSKKFPHTRSPHESKFCSHDDKIQGIQLGVFGHTDINKVFHCHCLRALFQREDTRPLIRTFTELFNTNILWQYILPRYKTQNLRLKRLLFRIFQKLVVHFLGIKALEIYVMVDSKVRRGENVSRVLPRRAITVDFYGIRWGHIKNGYIFC